MLKRQQLEQQKSSQGHSSSPMEIDPGSTGGPSSPTLPDWIHDGNVDLIAKTVEEFRHQRLSMVQSLRQFVLCYETVLEWLVLQQQAADGKAVPDRRSSSGD
jgi:protein-tyrosine phosphatase